MENLNLFNLMYTGYAIIQWISSSCSLFLIIYPSLHSISLNYTHSLSHNGDLTHDLSWTLFVYIILSELALVLFLY